MSSNKIMRVEPDDSWCLSTYRNEIYEHLKTLEQQRFVFQRRSPQFEERWWLIKWMKEKLEDIQFCRVTLHLAVFLLDFFMDSHAITQEKLTLIALTCLILAGKFEEQEALIPKITEMNAILESDYVQKDILCLEKKILKYFNWKLTMPTAIHFAEYFLHYAIIPQDVCKNCTNYKYVYTVLRYCLNDFLDCTLEDHLLITYSPSFIAASCLYAVRMTYSMEPIWPKQLQNVTSYSESDLKTCVERIIKFKENNGKQRKRKLEPSPDESPDQGYETEKSSTKSKK